MALYEGFNPRSDLKKFREMLETLEGIYGEGAIIEQKENRGILMVYSADGSRYGAYRVNDSKLSAVDLDALRFN